MTASALRGLAVSHSNKMKTVQESSVTPLTQLLASDDVEILRDVVACFCILVLCDKNKYEMVEAAAVAVLVSLSQSMDMLVTSQSCTTLANFTEISVNQYAIANEVAVCPTIAVVCSKSLRSSVKEDVCLRICVLLSLISPII